MMIQPLVCPSTYGIMLKLTALRLCQDMTNVNFPKEVNLIYVGHSVFETVVAVFDVRAR